MKSALHAVLGAVLLSAATAPHAPAQTLFGAIAQILASTVAIIVVVTR